ncbi:MAG: 4'-phosphopantetheinyl transferase superfamily protein [Flavobacteriales bacterium]
MPLLIYQSNFTNTSRLLIWKAIESTPELEKMIEWNEELTSKYESIKLEKRRREWLVARILLKIALPDAILYFLPSGKPMLEGRLHISISHCGDLGGIVISEIPVGLDIQGVDEKLEKISTRFCHPKELHRAMEQNEFLDYITIIWSAKEAVFKYFGEQLTFNEDMIIRPFSIDQEQLICDYKGVHGEFIFTLQHILLKGYHIVMTVGHD